MTDLAPRRFRALLQSRPGGRAIIELPFAPADAWGARDRYHITGTVDGRKVRGPLAADGAGFVLSLGPAWLRDCGLVVGTEVEVELAPEGPQQSGLDEDIAAALDAEPEAGAFFEALATFYRKAYLTWLAGAKRRPELRRARIAEFVALLKAGKKQRPR